VDTIVAIQALRVKTVRGAIRENRRALADLPCHWPYGFARLATTTALLFDTVALPWLLLQITCRTPAL